MNKELGRVWHKPLAKSLEIPTAISKPMKSQFVHEWAASIFASLEAQKQAKKISA
jgi:hypothetical protein